MKTCFAICMVLILSACNAHALRQAFTPEPTRVASHSRMQFNCTANGLFIFEDFPDLLTARTPEHSVQSDEGQISAVKRNNAEPTDECLFKLY